MKWEHPKCVMAGMGVAALLAVTVEAELGRGELAALAWSGPSLEVGTQVAHHKDKWLSPALESFLVLTWETMGASRVQSAG